MDSQPVVNEVPTPEPVGTEVTVEQAMKIAERIWWSKNLYSPEGLTHLFPGLRSK